MTNSKNEKEIIMRPYKCYCIKLSGKQYDIQAESSYQAVLNAKEYFQSLTRKKITASDVAVMLLDIVHTAN
jgi:hypothetical protein